jgi:hypothetical protein
MEAQNHLRYYSYGRHGYNHRRHSKHSNCHRCKKQRCGKPNDDQIHFLIKNIDHWIICLCEREIAYYKGGYDRVGCKGWEPKDDYKKLDLILKYKDILENMSRQIRNGSDCLCGKYFAELREKVKKILYKFEPLVAEKPRQISEEWILKNPGLVGIRRWELAYYNIEPNLVFDVIKNEKEVVDLVVEINKKSEDVGLDLGIYKQDKELSIEVIKKDSKVIEVSLSKKEKSELNLEIEKSKVDVKKA